MSPESIARVVHEANRALQIEQDDTTIGVSPRWKDVSAQMRASAIEGVEHAMKGHGPEEMHRKWLESKREAGWTYGVVKDEGRKTHPCMRPYEELEEHHRIKDDLFVAIVRVLA